MAPRSTYQLDADSGLAELTLTEIGFPPLHLVVARDAKGEREVLLELAGDAEAYGLGQ